MTTQAYPTRTCITCGDEFADRNTGMADHSQCYDCETAYDDDNTDWLGEEEVMT